MSDVFEPFERMFGKTVVFQAYSTLHIAELSELVIICQKMSQVTRRRFESC